MDLILVAVISLGAIGLIAAVILYAASKKFAVYEDPRIAQVSEVLPQANCGGCGYPGCSHRTFPEQGDGNTPFRLYQLCGYVTHGQGERTFSAIQPAGPVPPASPE